MCAYRILAPRLGISSALADPFGSVRASPDYKVFYEKDYILPVDPRRLPKIDNAKLAEIGEKVYGYKHLAYAQQHIAGHKVKMDLPQARGDEFDKMYDAFELWLNEAPKAEVDAALGIERG